MAYLTKMYYFFKKNYMLKAKEKIERLLVVMSSQENINLQQEIILQKIQLFKKNLPVVLQIMVHLDQDSNLLFWKKVRPFLISHVLLPQARKFAVSRDWLKRYLAVCCFNYKIETKDEHFLVRLIEDKRLLISLNASRIAVSLPTPKLLNTIIDTYAKGRRLQQSTFTGILSSSRSTALFQIIFERLAKEKNPYTKGFCYRLLAKLPSYGEISPTTEIDLKNNNIELKIAVINYLIHNGKAELIRSYLQDEHWEVRAIVAKGLGELHDILSIPLLKEHLQDPAWWVRANSATALMQMGEEGIKILHEQNPDVDRYAFEAAQYAILALKSNRPKKND